MVIEYDEVKRLKTLKERELDFADSPVIFNGPELTILDDRQNYGEDRYITYGYMQDNLVVLVWTMRLHNRRIISLRKANDRENRKFKKAMD